MPQSPDNSPLCKICGQPSTLLASHLFDDRYGYPGRFHVFVCSACGFGQTKPELNKKDLDALYTDYYPRKNINKESVENAADWKSGLWARWLRWLRGTNNTCHYHVRPETRVLDVGCGNGASLLEIQRMGAEAFGTEQDRNVTQIASDLHLNIFFGNVEEANYPHEFFHTITLSQVLEHIPDPLQFTAFLYTKLAPGGNLIMSFPNIDSYYRKKIGKRWINWHIPYHLNFFSEKSLEILAAKTGLRIKTICTITPKVWVELQQRNNRFEAIEGKSSPIWTSGNTQETSGRWKQRCEAMHALCMSLLQLPLIRIRDLRKQGDSWLVIMEKS
ncbi:MAG: hypothetical protein A3B74_00430 [Candidatus Kerfeldbacteria bacterium RIFCSPHIGHO2_02_FULL_42_14]|uniref:Uncharacterized protein n=1 Tax=Candidatus Kerfeldbacteria bacterium RIFCSPHIGHO2_02_FULL_42_14 TaxID=1798540 RepID=A0A1G2AQY2_9BACT|nr:MAG: hypothetical protein A3B74_00430 [Candidatus Kerfeldbacteria bacterium RIFCSPHIGHO2_02_FULL_42_14]OGY81262.1 MAG: hypothetical protein A3E60_02310 [Candidatus Kerfeldbacteria bacterium RIFCSPHIGHO2_12_FULL_42_13]OGY83537.1 MAG: hypothetical protein A3I91_02745 [Candidatus Kerfeldbacteria bacterium RIFCSPLOWO2_02_FULL_42_19]OGY85780.1 MAG: hypothetical protein A3G01_03965 [Candidatus Kerfeldbacteria bacterium RIFCSPLOWO2_12_FULL_43_9]